MQIGKSITQRDDRLTVITPEELFERIKSPADDDRTLIERLRLVRTIDAKNYAVLKKQLPYIVCGTFDPPFRRTEHFGSCEYFMIDIDHIGDKQMTVSAVKEQIMKDERALLCFVSPSEDGLKILFRLAEKCYDSGKYSLFYKCFARAFSQQYGLEQVLDARTSDVSRACFLSYDPEAYFNPQATPIRIEDFVDFDNPFETREIEKQMSELPHPPATSPKGDGEKEPDNDAFAFIKQQLFKKQTVEKKKPQVYVPEQLDAILDSLKNYITEANVVIDEIENISYGKKFKLHAGLSQAEINLFFGKKGFSVVASPRQGTSPELNDLMKNYVEAFIGDYIMLRQNVALTYQPNVIKAQLPEHELIKQQAQLLFTEKNFREALPLYATLWDSFPEKCDEWDGWRYAYCAQKLENYAQCLDICRKVYARYRDFKMIRNVYAWSVFYLEIKKTDIPLDKEPVFFKAGEAIVKLCSQEDVYSPYTIAVFKILDYLNEKANPPFDKILEWTAKLNPALLEKTAFAYTDKEGNTREIASKYEQYFMLRTRALLETAEWQQCIDLCNEALQTIDKPHYDNDIWFRWRIALAYEGLGEWEKSLHLQLELLKRKKEWFIQKEIAEQYYRLGDYEKSLQYALDSALNFGDNDKKINTFIVLANSLDRLGKTDDAQTLNAVIDRIKRKEKVSDSEFSELKKRWNALKFSDRQQFAGEIISVLPNGKAGFVKADDGKQYFFSMRNFKANPKKAVVGAKVSFYLEEGFDAKKGKKTMNATEIKITTKN
jgi:tetratricopeptide (TPR) repeat protein